MTNKLLLIDGNSLAIRSFYGLTKTENGLVSPSGVPINVCTGFLNTLAELISKYQIKYLAIAMDLDGPCFRNQIYEEYKANRPEKPSELKQELALLNYVLSELPLPIFTKPSYEADDLIATIVFNCKDVDNLNNIYIFSADKDLFQLIDPQNRVQIIHPSNYLINYLKVKEKIGVFPEQMVDFKAIAGDPSDNIKGVKGIGAKGACYLLEKYGSLAKIYENLKQIEPKYQNKLMNYVGEAGVYQSLAKLMTDVDINSDLNNCQLAQIDKTPAVINELGLNSVFNKLKSAIY